MGEQEKFQDVLLRETPITKYLVFYPASPHKANFNFKSPPFSTGSPEIVYSSLILRAKKLLT